MICGSFPSLIHLGLNLEINISHPENPIYPAATLNSAHDLWKHVWKEIIEFRRTQPHLVPRPRLRSLKINVGSFRFGHGITATNEAWARYEQREQQTFQVSRSEHDEEADAGIASVRCTQVERLLEKYGTGKVSIGTQACLLEETRKRAENGVMAEPDRRIGHETNPLIPNDFNYDLQMATIMPFFDDEELWLLRAHEMNQELKAIEH